MVSKARKVRGRRTEIVVANYFAKVWGSAKAVNSGASGSDILGTPFMIEIKSRKDFSPLSWVKQNEKRPDGKLAFVVYRANGMGESDESIDDYLFIARLGDMMPMLSEKNDPDSIVRCKCGKWTVKGDACWVCEALDARA